MKKKTNLNFIYRFFSFKDKFKNKLPLYIFFLMLVAYNFKVSAKDFDIYS